MILRSLALACALALPASAQSAPSASAPTSPVASSDIQSKTQLNVARNGKEVVISWALPADAPIKQFEICRNTRDQAQGRGRVAALRTEPSVYFDSVPEDETTYWYWLKITLADGQIVNVGPVSTPSAKVWTP